MGIKLRWKPTFNYMLEIINLTWDIPPNNFAGLKGDFWGLGVHMMMPRHPAGYINSCIDMLFYKLPYQSWMVFENNSLEERVG